MMTTLDEIRPITVAEAVATRLPAPDYILGPLQAGDIGLLVGADGAGKSLVALEMAATVAYGVPVAGVVDAPRHTGRVAYIAGEDRRDDHIRRLRRLTEHLAAHHGFTIDDDDDRLTVWPLAGRRLPLVEPAHDGYTVTTLGHQFAEAIAGHRLVVLDPLRMMHNCRELDGLGMDYLARWLISVAMRNDQAILVVHHASQAAIVDGRSDHQLGGASPTCPRCVVQSGRCAG